MTGVVATNDAYYRALRAQLLQGRTLAPVGVGVEVGTGRLIYGWDHTVQSIGEIFKTRYHERVMRYYVGSFVPAILGNNTVPSVITRFFWAVTTSIDLWEPRYRVQKISIRRPSDQSGSNYDKPQQPGDDQDVMVTTTDDDIRMGNIAFQLAGIYMPRGHLGDFTVEGQRGLVVLGSGNDRFRVRSVS